VKVIITKTASRALQRSNKRLLIAEKISSLASDPDMQRANIRKLQGRLGYRLRVQDWRVLFRVEGDTLLIDEIEPRSSVYEDRE
jgi:mRNA interferase RelE/StbE